MSIALLLAGLEFAASKLCCDAEARAALQGILQRGESVRTQPAPVPTDPVLELKTPAMLVVESTPVLESIMDRNPDGGPPFFRFRPNAMIGPNKVTNNVGLVMDHDVVVPKPAGVVRVVTLGASTTQGALQVPGYRYPDVLQHLLKDNPATAKWEVINAGHQGWGVRDVAESLRTDILPLQPDILIYYGEINDVSDSTMRVYRSADHALYERPIVAALARIRDHSKLWSYYIAPSLDPVLPVTGSVADFNWPEVLKPWKNGVEDILDTANDHGIKVLLVTYAYAVKDGQQATQAMRLYVDQGGWPAMKDPLRQYREGIAAENEILQIVASARGVPVAPAAEQLDGRLELFNDTVHMTPEGYAQLARVAAAGLPSAATPAVGRRRQPSAAERF